MGKRGIIAKLRRRPLYLCRRQDRNQAYGLKNILRQQFLSSCDRWNHRNSMTRQKGLLNYCDKPCMVFDPQQPHFYLSLALIYYTVVALAVVGDGKERRIAPVRIPTMLSGASMERSLLSKPTMFFFTYRKRYQRKFVVSHNCILTFFGNSLWRYSPQRKRRFAG